MAGCTSDLVDLNQDRIGVAIQIDRLYFLNMPAFFAFAPELLATATKIDDSAASESLDSCFLIHIGEHKYIAGVVVLSNDRNWIRFREVGAIHA